MLFLIGLGIGWFSLFLRGLQSEELIGLPVFERILQAANNFENIRILGVLQRLALVSFFGSLIVLLFKPKHIPWIIGFILVAYWAIIYLSGSMELSSNSLIAIIDRNILGEAHMYTSHLADGSAIAFDPEGILSTLPCIAHVLLGFWAGKLISETKGSWRKNSKTLYLWNNNYVHWIFDRLWISYQQKNMGSSFVLTTCGLASLLLGLLIWIIDIKKKKNAGAFSSNRSELTQCLYML